MIYTIQYKTNNGIVQATIYIPLPYTQQNSTGETVKKVVPVAEVTQFVDEDGNVKGAYRLGTSIMMAATAIATVMMS